MNCYPARKLTPLCPVGRCRGQTKSSSSYACLDADPIVTNAVASMSYNLVSTAPSRPRTASARSEMNGGWATFRRRSEGGRDDRIVGSQSTARLRRVQGRRQVGELADHAESQVAVLGHGPSRGDVKSSAFHQASDSTVE